MHNALYTPADLDCWESNFAANIAQEVVLLRSAAAPGMDGMHLHGLALMQEQGAQTAIARGRFGQALGWRVAAVEVMCALYERFAAGAKFHPDYVSAGNLFFLLHAHTTRREPLVSRFNTAYALSFTGAPKAQSMGESLYLGNVIRALSSKQIDEALQLLSDPPVNSRRLTKADVIAYYEGRAERPPSLEQVYPGYYACILAIARGDRPAFESAMLAADDKWYRYARNNWRGVPDCVSFLYGAGIVALAESVWGEEIDIATPNLPVAILRQGAIEHIDAGFP